MLVAQRQELFAMLRPASFAIVTGLTLSSTVPGLAQSGVISGYAFSDGIATKVVRAAHGDSSGVRGAAWLWPIKKT